ncbi:MerC domain-containing protein [Flammeovirga agarivorans]|uniref:MerC domain-containing protein n=1 Tax=Flammeovirga agarivorans TaxID=2726742 RepID=A0A7X8SQD6_9BACT|nr:MerC domain-containing protein [Flammeovirga agarivorans]NLR94485.1 MerC domain-containing protein [Flammeovirga agarivorans]
MYALKREFIRYTDQIGITGSFVCLVHCIITSGVMIGSSFLSHSTHHHHDHIHHIHQLDIWGMIDLSMIVISGMAVYFSTLKCSAQSLQNKLMWGSYIIYALSMISKYIGFEPVWLSGLSYAMSFMLIGLHLRNIKNCEH